MAGGGGQEVVAIERVHAEVRRSPDRGRAGDVPEQGDLAEALPGPSTATWIPWQMTLAWPSATM